jgi:hypothetical protein
MSRFPSPRRCATAMLSLSLTAVVCLAPLPALADGSIAAASLQLRAPLSQAPLGFKMRQYVSLQDPAAGEVPPVEGTPPPPVEGTAPAPAYGPPPPGYGYGPPPPGYGYGPPPQPPPRGLGMLISGAAVTGAVGLPLTIYGAYIVALGRQVDDGSGVVETAGNFVGGFFLVFGILALGAGVPLMAVGGVRLKKYNDWKAGQQQPPPQARLLPSSSRTIHGTWVTGLKIQF